MAAQLLPDGGVIAVACVNASDYLGRGREYVDKLRSMVARNLKQPHAFVCLSDRPPDPDEHGDWPTLYIGLSCNRKGWWNKVDVFRPGLFPNGWRILYLDLDTVITGPLDELVKHKGILHLADWGWKKNDYGSGVMVWDAGEHEEIFTRYDATVPHCFKGDQDYITHLGGWPALPKGMNVSYRYHAKDGPPAGAVTCSFHGAPKMHEFPPDHWVTKAWRE